MTPHDEAWNDLPAHEKARSLSEAAKEAARQGQEQTAFAYYTQSLNLYRGLGDRANVARILVNLSYLAGWADFGDGLDMFARRRRLGEEALALYREVGDRKGTAAALITLAAVMPRDEAHAMLEESLALSRECGDRSGEAYALLRLGGQAALSGSRKEARRLQEEALRLYREAGAKESIASTLFSLSIQASPKKKLAYLKEALALQRELGNKRRVAEILLRLTWGDVPETSAEEQEVLCTEALAVCREIQTPNWTARCLDRLAKLARARGDDARAEALEAESRSIYQPRKLDPAAEQALTQAIGSGDVQAVAAAMKLAFHAPAKNESD